MKACVLERGVFYDTAQIDRINRENQTEMSFCATCASLDSCPQWILDIIDKQKLTDDQGSEYWLKVRAGMITASDAPSVLGESFYKKPFVVTQEKAYAIAHPNFRPERVTSEAMEWGTKHEAEAAAYFSAQTGHKLIFTGLLRHATLPLLGASPDGITWCGSLLEIKCPHSKIPKTLHKVPPQYRSQVEMQMVVIGIPRCYFVQYRPANYGDKGAVVPGAPTTFHLLQVKQDPDWFDTHYPTLERAANDIQRLVLAYKGFLLEEISE